MARFETFRLVEKKLKKNHGEQPVKTMKQNHKQVKSEYAFTIGRRNDGIMSKKYRDILHLNPYLRDKNTPQKKLINGGISELL